MCVYIYVLFMYMHSACVHPCVRPSMCLICIYGYVHVSIYVHILVHPYVHICMYVGMYICLSLCLSLYTYVYIYIHISLPLSLSTYLYTSIYIYIYMYRYMPIYKYTHAKIDSNLKRLRPTVSETMVWRDTGKVELGSFTAPSSTAEAAGICIHEPRLRAQGSLLS